MAPTPSGRLHVGNIYNFILTWWLTRAENGQLVLRIDDADELRTKDEYLEDIFQTLDWLHMDYDEGPRSVSEFKEHFSQVHKKAHYRFFLEELQDIFPCSCSRKSVDSEGHYQGGCFDKEISPSLVDVSLRCYLPPFYPVLWRKDNIPAYHLTSLIDDQDLGINCVVRGDDLIPSSLLQKNIATILQVDFPKEVFHHQTIKGQDQEKLSKTQGAQSVRDEFSSPRALFHFIASVLGVEPFDSLQELKDRPFPIEVLEPLL